MNNKTLVLNSTQIQAKIERIAWQIYEDNFDQTNLLIVAIQPRGIFFGELLKTHLSKISPLTLEIMHLKVDKDAQKLIFEANEPLTICIDKSIVLVDDVLNTGKTLAYAASIFADYRIKKLRTAILINRNHRLFPITADFVGLNIATVLQEHVSVEFSKENHAEAYLI